MNSLINISVKILLILCFITCFSFSYAQTHEVDSLQLVLKKLPPDINRVNTLIELCMAQDDAKEIIQPANEALALSQKINFKEGEARAYFELGYYYNKMGDNTKSLESLLKALAIYENVKNIEKIASTCNSIGLIYQTQGETKTALAFFKRAYSAWNKSGSKLGISIALENLGSVYGYQHKDSLALIHYEQSLKLSKEINNKERISSALNSIGSIYFKNKEYTKSLECQQKALQYAVESKNCIAQVRANNAMSQIHLAQNRPEEALLAAESSLKTALSITSKSDIADSYYQVYKAYEKLNNYKKAYEFQTIYMELSDSLKNSETRNSIEKIKLRYELDKKEVEIALLTFRRNIAIVILVGLLIIGLLLYNRYRLITKRRLASKKLQLDFYIKNLLEKSETINRINQELEQIKGSYSSEDVQIVKIDKILQTNILTDDDWKRFRKAFEDIYPAFFSKLRYQYPAITVSELRLAALIKLNLSSKEMAAMLGISHESVNKSRYRLKKKLGLTEHEIVKDFIEKFEVPQNHGT